MQYNVYSNSQKEEYELVFNTAHLNKEEIKIGRLGNNLIIDVKIKNKQKTEFMDEKPGFWSAYGVIPQLVPQEVHDLLSNDDPFRLEDEQISIPVCFNFTLEHKFTNRGILHVYIKKIQEEYVEII